MSNILPPALVKRLNEQYNFEEELFFKVHEEGETVTSVRINPFKDANIFAEAEQVPWSSYGRYLDTRPSFIADPLFHAGCYYVQEASSMFIEHILREHVSLDDDLRILDLCAAPGGKSTLIASLISKDSLLVSNEIIRSRVNVLSDNLTKWGILNSVVSNNDPKDFSRLEGYFDVLVVDAPCSGSGMWRKDPGTVNEWSESNVQLCSQRQQRILADALPSLKKGGLLIYSTCSYSAEENEAVADWLSASFAVSSLRVSTEQEWNIVETTSPEHKCYGYRFYPHKVRGEGFFVSCFRKEEGSVEGPPVNFKPVKVSKNDQSIIRNCLSENEDIAVIPVKEGYSVINARHTADVQLLQSKLYLKKSGLYAGKIIGKDLIPEHDLALSLSLSDSLSRAELSYDQAIAYLRKDELRLNDARTGWCLMCYKGYPLGWAKVLPNRVNNYLPKELRILKDI